MLCFQLLLKIEYIEHRLLWSTTDLKINYLAHCQSLEQPSQRGAVSFRFRDLRIIKGVIINLRTTWILLRICTHKKNATVNASKFMTMLLEAEIWLDILEQIKCG